MPAENPQRKNFLSDGTRIRGSVLETSARPVAFLQMRLNGSRGRNDESSAGNILSQGSIPVEFLTQLLVVYHVPIFRQTDILKHDADPNSLENVTGRVLEENAEACGHLREILLPDFLC